MAGSEKGLLTKGEGADTNTEELQRLATVVEEEVDNEELVAVMEEEEEEEDTEEVELEGKVVEAEVEPPEEGNNNNEGAAVAVYSGCWGVVMGEMMVALFIGCATRTATGTCKGAEAEAKSRDGVREVWAGA